MRPSERNQPACILTGTSMSVTINGETRNVEVEDVRRDGSLMVSTKSVGLFRKGAGKEWAQRINLWKNADGTYRLDRSATILNRHAYSLTGWSSEIRNPSAHNSASYAVGAPKEAL